MVAAWKWHNELLTAIIIFVKILVIEPEILLRTFHPFHPGIEQGTHLRILHFQAFPEA